MTNDSSFTSPIGRSSPMHRLLGLAMLWACLSGLCPASALAQEPPPRNDPQPFRPAIPSLPDNVNLENGTGEVTAPPPSSFVPSTPTAAPASAPPGTPPPAVTPAATTPSTNPTQLPAVAPQTLTAQPTQGVPGGTPPSPQPQASAPPPTSATLSAQQPAGNRSTALTDQTAGAAWQQTNPAPPAGTAAAGMGTASVGSAPAPTATSGAPSDITRVTQTFSSLPNDAGQIWREYDISPYTSQIRDNPNPEQVLVDWILRQTGTELWFRQPFGLLSATRDKLFVYHTPEIHNEIRPLVDRFVFSKGQTVGIDIRLCTIANPNWRESAYAVMQSIPVQSPGVEAWLISKENAAILLGNLARRSDYRAAAGGRVSPQDGQPFVLEQRTPRQFAQSIQWTPGQGAGYQPLMNQLNEGYRLKLASLSAVDGRTVDLLLEGSIDQIEKFSPIRVPVTTLAGPQNITLQVPQLVSWRLTERFRWPADQVLLISCGVVAAPESTSSTAPQPLFGQSLGGLFDTTRKRADALLFIDYRGPQVAPSPTPQTTQNNLVPIR